MAATPEKKVKDAAVRQLKTLGAYYFFPVTGGFGTSGVPDIVGCYHGYFFAIECKAGRNKPTALQQKNMHQIDKAGGIVWVVNEENVAHVTARLMKMTTNNDGDRYDC